MSEIVSNAFYQAAGRPDIDLISTAPKSGDANCVEPANTGIIVASLMSGGGPTGVETHFNAILKAADEHGIHGQLVTPYSSTRWLQRLANFAVNQLKRFDSEKAHLFLRRVQARRMHRHLISAIANAAQEKVIVYAQDPLSAQVAIELQGRFQFQVVAVAHFNISEAEEFLEKGVASRDGALWNALIETEMQALPKVDRLIFVSDYMRRKITERIEALRFVDTRVIPNFTQAGRSAADSTLPERHAISIGTLEPRKNQQFLIRVIAECNKQGYVYSLDIAGTGEDQTMLKDLSRELGVEEQVRFLGFVPNASSLICDYQVLLHAAKMESFGIVLIEAMACSTPVVANPVGGVPEVFTDGVEGLYWNTSCIEAAAKQLIGLLQNKERYDAMRTAAFLRFKHNFDSTIMARRWVSAIRGV